MKVVRLSAVCTGKFYPSINIAVTHFCCGPDSSVGIATDYVMGSPGCNFGEGDIFRSSRPVLGPLTPVYNGYRVFAKCNLRPWRAANHSLPSSACVMEE